MSAGEGAEALDRTRHDPAAAAEGARATLPVSFRQQVAHTRTADGVRIAHATSGHGPVLVKASNGLGHLEFDAGSAVWGHLLAELSSDHLLVRHDRRGCGLSDWDVAAPSLDTWVTDLESVVAAHRLERFPLLGVSDGAAVALAYAARHPERVSRLVLHGAWARPLRRWAGALVDHDITDLREAATTAALAERMHDIEDNNDLTASLHRVVCPTLLLHGAGDPEVPLTEARWLADTLHDAHLVELDSPHHWLRATEPAWDRWLLEVRRFLPPEPDPSSPYGRLTTRELDIVDLLAQGHDNTTVATLLNLSMKTVRNHVSNLYRKLGTANRTRTVAQAREAGYGRTFRPGKFL